MKFSEFFKFLGRYVKNPSQIGAVCPSSRFLARKMAECASGRLGASGVVAELGAGTGAVTRRLVETGCADSPRGLYSIEFDAVLAGLLRESFPAVKVVNGSAENLRAILGDDLPRLAAVISSLPLLSLPKPVVKKILDEAESALPSGGVFVQFTYNLARSPSALGFKKMRHIGRSIVLLNVPPARVDVFEKL